MAVPALARHAQRALWALPEQRIAWSACGWCCPPPSHQALAQTAACDPRAGAAGFLTRLYANASSEAAGSSGKAAGEQQAGEAAASGPGADGGADEDGAAGPSQAELQALMASRDEEINQLKGQLNDLTDAFKRNLAEMENLRERTRREIDTARKFAIQGFVKSLLDVADNMGRALEAVPPREEHAGFEAARALQLLGGLQEGVQATERILLQILRQSGVEQYNPLNESFDPNKHMAMFEVADPTKEAGTVAVVTKRGYTMHDRVLRAAEVGVVKAPPS